MSYAGTMASRKKYSLKEKSQYAKEKAEAQREHVKNAVLAIKNSEGFKTWVDSRSKFHNYSLYNTLLIAHQRPDATDVAGAKQWERKFNRKVNRGEKAIWILAPITYKSIDQATGDEEMVFTGRYRAVMVFDVTQTDGDPLPSAPEWKDVEGDELADKVAGLEGYARELGYVVEYVSEEELGGARGQVNLSTRKIQILDTMSGNGKVHTLIHELAHARGDGEQEINYTNFTRPDAETIVECVTMILMRELGVDCADTSAPYIAIWDKDKSDVETLEKFTKTIDAVARELEAAVGLRKRPRVKEEQ